MAISEFFAGKNFPASSNKCREQEAPERLDWAFTHFGTSHHQLTDVNNSNINIYLVFTMLSTTLLKPIKEGVFKVLIQSKRTRWFMDQTLCSAFVHGIVRVGYSPLFFYYELLDLQCEVDSVFVQGIWRVGSIQTVGLMMMSLSIGYSKH